MTSESRTMASRTKSIFKILFSDHCTNRKTVSESFSKRNNIRTQFIMLISKSFSGSPDSSLDFIDNNQDILFFGNLLNGVYELLLSRDYATFTLNHLKHDCSSIIIYYFL